MSQRIRSGIATSMAIAMLTVACSGDDNTTSEPDNSPSDSPPASSESVPESETDTPSGEPLVIGFVNQEGDPAGDYSDFHVGIDAAIAHVNENEGGIDGRPLALEFCSTRAASGGDTCANDMVQAGVPMVMGGYNSHTGPMLPILESADIPLISAAALNSGDFADDGNHWTVLISTLSGYVATGQYISSLEPERLSIIYIDAPPPLQASEILAGTVEPGGTTVELFPLDPQAPDVTPVVTAATADEPDVVMLTMAPPACGKVMAAIDQLSIETQVITPPGCIDTASLESAGSGAAGTQFFSPIEPVISADPSPEMQAFLAALEAIDGGQPTQRGAEGFAMVMTVASILDASGGAGATAETITAFMQEANSVDVYMGVPFTCQPPTLSQAPAVCADGVRIWEVNEELTVQDVGGRVFTAAGSG